MRAVLTTPAQRDVREAAGWYRARGHGLDRSFLEALDAAIEALCDHPGLGPVVDRNVRRHLLRGFPYALFYLVLEEQLIIVGCFHGARDPSRWRGRARRLANDPR